MEPDRKKRKRGFGFFGDDAFGSIDDIFERMQQDMLEQMKRMRGMRLDMSEDELKRLSEDPNVKVYGYSFRVGPDGKPHFREFGNVKRPQDVETMQESAGGHEKGAEEEPSGREPLVDVFNSEGKTTVIAELPGVEEKDIRISLKGKALQIKVDKGSRKYYRKLELPSAFSKSRMKQKYNNGVLELEFS